ncbi:MAG: hypothetical protein SFV15_09800 [Polyangiaceae bacterium]|nr:hypothetical protein [Polyangiaceae bacterium]
MSKALGKLGIISLLGLALTSAAQGARAGSSSEQNSYPYDPTCQWGRISDGKGMLLRCLSVNEAKALAGGKLAKSDALPAATPNEGATKGADKPSATGNEKTPQKATDKLAEKATEDASTPVAPTVSAADLEAPAEEVPAAPELGVEVDPVKADKGEFPRAKLNVASAKARYLGCIDKNGGISQSTAEVVVRFLVRDRERAEGVSVKSFKGMSKQAAKCVADVVDRRHVGDPDGAFVGASVRIAFAMSPKQTAAEKP